MNLRIAIKVLKRNGPIMPTWRWKHRRPDRKRAETVVKHYRWKEWKRGYYTAR